jgi:DNA-binding NarL/FixJ family response regulator
MVLAAEEDIEVVGEAPNGRAGVAQALALKPDVVLMDVRMPDIDGIEATRQIVKQLSETRVLVLTTFDLDDYAFGAIRAGASGFLLKNAHPADLVASIRDVAAGEAVLSSRVTRRMLEMFSGQMPNGSDSGRDARLGELADILTPREMEVLDAISDGLTNAEIAERFTVSETTVKTHVGNLLSKLHLRDRVQVVIYVYEHGLK